MTDFINQFEWHSSTGFDKLFSKNKVVYNKIKNTRKARSMFLVASKDYLIHKTTNALWKISNDGKFIEALFDEDILTGEDLEME